MNPSLTLEVRNLRCERGERPLFADLSFALHAGELLWLRGRNGQGKTSLLRTLAGLSEPAAGEIFWHGRTARESGAEGRRALLHVGHANALKEDLTVAESLRFFSRLRDGSQANEPNHGLNQNLSDAQLDNALLRVGLAGFALRSIRTLSQGQRRRVALARLALGLEVRAAPAPVWLLDEPFDALDADGVARLVALITEHATAGGGVLFTSHLEVPALGPALRVLELDTLLAPHDEIAA